MRHANGIEVPRVLTAPQAARLGLTRARARTELRRGNWQRLASGVLLTRPDEPSRADWAEVGVALAGEGAAVTGWDALRAIGIGDRTPPPAPPVVLMRTGLTRHVGPADSGVRLRRTNRAYSWRLLPLDAELLALTPITTPARAVADAALQYRGGRGGRALVTTAVGHGVCSVAELGVELAHGPRNHSSLLRATLADAAAGARSVAEAEAARRLARAPVPPFELNVPILAGGRRFVVDVLWRRLRAVLEIDSAEYHLGEREWRATMARHNALIRLGFAVAHYAPSATRAPQWPAEVAAWVRARADELGVAAPAGRGVLPGPPRPVVLEVGA